MIVKGGNGDIQLRCMRWSLRKTKSSGGRSNKLLKTMASSRMNLLQRKTIRSKNKSVCVCVRVSERESKRDRERE